MQRSPFGRDTRRLQMYTKVVEETTVLRESSFAAPTKVPRRRPELRLRRLGDGNRNLGLR